MAENQTYPFLRSLLWQGDRERDLSDQDMLSIYERGWRFRDVLSPLGFGEIAYVKHLASTYGSWLELECERLLISSTRMGVNQHIGIGHAASDVISLMKALRGEFMLGIGLGLSGHTALFSSINDIDVPDKVSLTLVNSSQNLREFRRIVSTDGPLALFDEKMRKSFSFGPCYFDQLGMWVSIRPKVSVPAIKLAVTYDTRDKTLHVPTSNEGWSKGLPIVAPDDELLFAVVDAAECGASFQTSDIDLELLVLLSGYVERIEPVAEKILSSGISRIELQSTLIQLLSASQPSRTSEKLFATGRDRLKGLLDQISYS
ncbi:MAG: hypothetical protein AXW12_15750 [Thalassospira sp. Nap_22]|nr:MAG: hypothetical protein AXW12_15750 [Thalassospira sp. Nap_22]